MMAILTSEELTELRHDLSNDRTVTWNKAEANLAFQAVEDWERANENKRESAIESAVPGKFNNVLKKAIGGNRLRQEHKKGKK